MRDRPQEYQAVKMKTIPPEMKRYPKPLPMMDAILVDLRRLRERHQRKERSTRPPSRGNPGIMLKMARKPFIHPSQKAIPASGDTEIRVPRKMPQHAALIMRLVPGPATARRNSWPGDFGSSVSCETPPKMNREIALTFRPAALATRL